MKIEFHVFFIIIDSIVWNFWKLSRLEIVNILCSFVFNVTSKHCHFKFMSLKHFQHGMTARWNLCDTTQSIPKCMFCYIYIEVILMESLIFTIFYTDITPQNKRYKLLPSLFLLYVFYSFKCNFKNCMKYSLWKYMSLRII